MSNQQLQTEEFYKTICKKHMATQEKEMLLEQNNGTLFLITIRDECLALKHDGKINNINYRAYLDYDDDIIIYESYRELYFSIEDMMGLDIEDLGLFDENGNWNFYLSFEELQEMGYGYKAEYHYPLISKYFPTRSERPDRRIPSFFNSLTLKQLNEYENILASFSDFLKEELDKLCDEDGNIIIEKICSNSKLKYYEEQIDWFFSDFSDKLNSHSTYLFESQQSLNEFLSNEPWLQEDLDSIAEDFHTKIKHDSYDYFEKNFDTTFFKKLYNFEVPSHVLYDNVEELVHNLHKVHENVEDEIFYTYGVNFNCITDKYFKGNKKVVSQESPKKDTFDMDK